MNWKCIFWCHEDVPYIYDVVRLPGELVHKVVYSYICKNCKRIRISEDELD